MEWADPAVHRHGILRCRRVVFVRTQGKRNRSALDHLQFPISMWAIIGRLANKNQHNFPSSSRSPCIPLRFHDKGICIEKIVTKAAPCTPSCGSSVRRWVARSTKHFSIKCKFGVSEYVLEKTDMISDYTGIVNTVLLVA